MARFPFPAWIRFFSTVKSFKMAEDLYSFPIQLRTKFGELVELNAVYQDTKPEGSSLGTFLTIHGAPGSHKDFKYITPKLVEAGIRVIGVNIPGLGLTPGRFLCFYKFLFLIYPYLLSYNLPPRIYTTLNQNIGKLKYFIFYVLSIQCLLLKSFRLRALPYLH